MVSSTALIWPRCTCKVFFIPASFLNADVHAEPGAFWSALCWLNSFPLDSSDFNKIIYAKAEHFENPRSQVHSPCAPICAPKFQLPLSIYFSYLYLLAHIVWSTQPESPLTSVRLFSNYKNQATCFEVLRHRFRPRMLKNYSLNLDICICTTGKVFLFLEAMSPSSSH